MEGEAVVLERVLPVLDAEDQVLIGPGARRALPQRVAHPAGDVAREQPLHGVVPGGVVVHPGRYGGARPGHPVDADRVEPAARRGAARPVGQRVVGQRVEVRVGLDPEPAAGQTVGVAEHAGERDEVERALGVARFAAQPPVERRLRRVGGVGQREAVGAGVVLRLAGAVLPVRYVVGGFHRDPAAMHDRGGVVMGVSHGGSLVAAGGADSREKARGGDGGRGRGQGEGGAGGRGSGAGRGRGPGARVGSAQVRSGQVRGTGAGPG